MTQNQYMDHALNAALDGQKLGEVPIGCVIIDENKNILSLTHNRVIGDNDPTAHAEILAIREACSKIQASRLVNCSLYVTLEPCLMCASAISRAKIKRLFYGADDNKYGSINGSINFYELLGYVDKWLFLATSLLFFVIISLKIAGKLISLSLILAYIIYFTFLYL